MRPFGTRAAAVLAASASETVACLRSLAGRSRLYVGAGPCAPTVVNAAAAMAPAATRACMIERAIGVFSCVWRRRLGGFAAGVRLTRRVGVGARMPCGEPYLNAA